MNYTCIKQHDITDCAGGVASNIYSSMRFMEAMNTASQSAS